MRQGGQELVGYLLKTHCGELAAWPSLSAQVVGLMGELPWQVNGQNDLSLRKQESHPTPTWGRKEPTLPTSQTPLRNCSPTLLTQILFLACGG